MYDKYTELGSVTLKCSTATATYALNVEGATATVKCTAATMEKIIENIEIFIILLLGFSHKHLMIIKQFQNISRQLYCN